jgi:hypothetical protein
LQDVHPFYLITFLTGKRARLPVGRMMDFELGANERVLLEEFYKPAADSRWYFRVSTAGVKEKRWVDHDYPGSGSQKTRTTTFAGALLHAHDEDKWGWTKDYVAFLQGKLKAPIPAFYLAAWLFRQRDWPPGTKAATIRSTFFDQFHITEDEKAKLFDVNLPTIRPEALLSPEPVMWRQLKTIIGAPPDAQPDEGAVLISLRLIQIGPATTFDYKPAERLNIITGDNSLGKTFILECIWWALTGEWLDQPVLPRRNVDKDKPRIEFSISTEDGSPEAFSVPYLWDSQKWDTPAQRTVLPGLVIYARFDGSFAIWDPARVVQMRGDESWRGPNHVFLTRNSIWRGEFIKDRVGRERWLCNGLLRDWVSWQTSGARYRAQYHALVACLKRLSPGKEEPLTPGDPTRIPLEALEIPTLKMPYGLVPVTNASAGVQRAIALAYVMVWSWNEHFANSQLTRRPPQNRLVLIIDEVEAHLHPRWQRVIVPAVMNSVSELSNTVKPQIHLATHSPLVMASCETVFEEAKDDLHHLKLGQKGQVILEELPFVKRGRVDRWLMSEVFGLGEARSVPAEEAIADAKALQDMANPPKKKVQEVNQRLIDYLAQHDDFWPRWRFFAKQHGVDE